MNEPPPTVLIAAGTAWETSVVDLRDAGPWCRFAAFARQGQPRLIVYHHTATAEAIPADFGTLEARLRLLASVSPYGLPYNFVVGPGPDPTICYLNDIDYAWPHTLGHNDAVAICALGNYELAEPDMALVPTMGRLADALAVMWERFVPEVSHRQLSATACPGANLHAALVLMRDLLTAE